jgi:predicted extracellular nuclease
MKKILFLLALLPASIFSQTTNLLFSEYGEGSGGSKKYIEIYNGTGATVDLSNYQIWKNVNGSAWNFTTAGVATAPLSLTGTLANGATYVIANNLIDVVGANLYNTFIQFNGDDATGLAWNGGSGTTFTLIDAFGEQLIDPGTGWAVAGVANATMDKILTRKTTVCSPNTNWTLSRGTTTLDSEWEIAVTLYNLTSQTAPFLGLHTTTCATSCNTTATI